MGELNDFGSRVLEAGKKERKISGKKMQLISRLFILLSHFSSHGDPKEAYNPPPKKRGVMWEMQFEVQRKMGRKIGRGRTEISSSQESNAKK